MSELRERELRDLLDRVSDIDGDVDVEEHWTAGRRRRTRRAAGLAIVTGVAAIAAVGAVAQSGLLGGAAPGPVGPTGPSRPTGPAAVPDHLETFVFAGEDATGPLDETAELHAPTVDDLAGTVWVLQGQMWGSRTVATDLTGTTASTALIFTDEATSGWSITVGGCGRATVRTLELDTRGRFVNPAPPVAGGQDCPEDVRAAEDFWVDALSGGGQLTLLEDGQRLLLSVDAPAQETPDPTNGPQPTPTVEPGEDEDGTDDDGTAAATPPPPATSPTTPTGTAPDEPADAGSTPGTDPGGGAAAPRPPAAPPPAAPPPAAPPRPAAPSAEPAFLDPGQESLDQPWPGGAGGALFAPSLRAGVHDGFDRVVVDVTGTGDLGWRASYTDDPRLDGSGEPSDIAGDSVLELQLSGMAYPEPGSDVYSEGIFGLDTHDLGAVVEVQRTAPFEGMLHVFVGMQGEPRPYRVFLLQDPMRLVVDVQTS